MDTNSDDDQHKPQPPAKKTVPPAKMPAKPSRMAAFPASDSSDNDNDEIKENIG
jgi:hypothetical protein